MSDKYVKGGFKTQILNETENLDTLNYAQIALLILQLVIQIFEAVSARFRAQRPPIHMPVPVVRAMRRNSDFAIDID